jgi:ribose transport system ATP-binding protein
VAEVTALPAIGGNAPALRGGAMSMRGVRKRFGAAVALEHVDLTVQPGEVHALIGENGAGKSTLMKVLSGALAPDAGSIEWEGKPYRPRGPLDARRSGVAMIYQELSLCPDLSVRENVMLGREPHRLGVIDRAQARARVSEALGVLHHPEISPERKVSELGPGARQLVEVARALVSDARIVVMDEPTSSLSHADVERLLSVIARLRERGVSVIYISHALEELARVADRYTVLRDGRSVKTGAIAGTSRAELIEAMVGRKLEDAFPTLAHTPGEVVLELTDVFGAKLPRGASLQLRRGEILGIAGLVGAGRTELLRALFGLDPVARGEIKLAGVTDHGRPPWVRLAQGMGLLSERRAEEGLATALSLAINLTLPALSESSRHGWIDRTAQRAAARRFISELSIRGGEPERAVMTLSGGNQQKVAIARLLHCDADVLLLDEPTRGVDVGSKAEIYRLIGELARAGKAVLFVSSYLPELLGICDRIAVMHRGRLGAARAATEWTEQSVMEEATRGAALG